MILDSKYPDLAASYNGIGYTYSKLGDAPKAIEYEHKAIVINEQILDPMDPYLATSYINIAASSYLLRDY